MSTDYLPWDPQEDNFTTIKRDDLMALKPEDGVWPDQESEQEKDHVVLTDGKNFVHAYFNAENGTFVALQRMGGNLVDSMLEAIKEKFGIEIYCEGEDEYIRIMQEDEDHDILNEED